MNNDTVVSIMGMTKEELDYRINLANRVLNQHNKNLGLLNGRLDDNNFNCITQYKDMLNAMHSNPLDVPKNIVLGFGWDKGLSSHIS